ncbi:glutathione S-transferase [Myxozyma melibiosi]|uniref:Glutathione S-transferase n=1 Tax=Myxozyma melibiosi TaxID=54550 RepID=A0ABR1EZ95_9ASCO
MSSPDLTLYTDTAPNGVKITMALEYLGLPYKTVTVSISKLEQKEPWFLEINPNGRIPALVDNTGGKQKKLMESGAILLYLADKYDPEYKLSYPAGSDEYYEVLEWLFWQVGGLGPMQGQTLHFLHYCVSKSPEVRSYGVARYQNETRRLFTVLESRLALQKSTKSSPFLVGDHLSVADLACLGWVLADNFAGIASEDYPLLNEWQDMVSGLEGVKKGLEGYGIKKVGQDPELTKIASEYNSKWIKIQFEEQLKLGQK